MGFDPTRKFEAITLKGVMYNGVARAAHVSMGHKMKG
jgi:hypothetical protein